jgi:hypothetical protein
MEKKRFDYALIEVVDKDDVTTLHGKGIDDLPKECIPYLANVGLLVMFQRSLAASKDCPLTLEEKQAKVDNIWKWLSNGMPKRTKIMMTPEEKAKAQRDTTIKTMRDAVVNGTAAEKKLVENIISRM